MLVLYGAAAFLSSIYILIHLFIFVVGAGGDSCVPNESESWSFRVNSSVNVGREAGI